MTTKITKTYNLTNDTAEYGVSRVLKNNFSNLIALGPNPTNHICRLLRDHLMSSLGLNYFSKLNLLVKEKQIGTTPESQDELCRWIDNDVMDTLNGLCETDVFDNPRTLSELSDIAITVHSSLNTIDEQDIEHEVDYLLDIPYQLNEMIKHSPEVPWFYKRSWQQEENDMSKKVTINMSEKQVSISYTLDVKW